MVRAHKTPLRSTRDWPWGLVLAAFACVLSIGGCEPTPPALTVGTVAFTQAQLAAVPEAALGTLVATTALALATANQEVQARSTALRARAEMDGLAAAALREVTLAAAGVGDAQLRARYETAPAHELDVRHAVFLADRTLPDRQRAEARRKAEATLVRAHAGEDFASLAAELSEEPGASERGGLLQPGREGQWVDEFWNAAQLLGPGQVSPVVESVFGFHVLKLEAKRVIPFAEVRDRVAGEVAALLPAEPATLVRDSMATEVEVTLSDPEVPASWTGGTLSASEFRTFVVTGTAAEYRATMGSADARSAAIRRAATSKALSLVAQQQGLTADPQIVDQVVREFGNQASGWAAVLGLAGSPAPAGVAARALVGLGATGQNATIARREMEERAPLLLTFYRVTGLEMAPEAETEDPSSP